MAWFAWFETLADASPHHDVVEWAAKTPVMVRSGPSGPRLEPRKDLTTAIFQTGSHASGLLWMMISWLIRPSRTLK